MCKIISILLVIAFVSLILIPSPLSHNLIKSLETNKLLNLVVITIILLTATMDDRMFIASLLLAIVYIMVLTPRSTYKEIAEHFFGGVMGSPVADCDLYSPEQIKFTGTAFYPLNNSSQDDTTDQIALLEK